MIVVRLQPPTFFGGILFLLGGTNMKPKEFPIPKLTKSYVNSVLTYPPYGEQYKLTTMLIQDFRAKLPPHVINDFDKLLPEINKRLLSSHFAKFLAPSTDYPFDILMLIVIITVAKKQKTKNKRIWNNLDIIHKIALDGTLEFLKHKKKRPTPNIKTALIK